MAFCLRARFAPGPFAFWARGRLRAAGGRGRPGRPLLNQINPAWKFSVGTSTRIWFCWQTSTRDEVPRQNRSWFHRKSVLCRCFRPERLHKAGFFKETAGQVSGNQICVDVRPRNLDRDRVSLGNVRTGSISTGNVYMELSFLAKPQVASLQIGSVSMFSLGTSTQIGFLQESRRLDLGKPNLCRRFSLKPRQKPSSVSKCLHRIGFSGKVAGGFDANRICAEVSARSVDINRISRQSRWPAFGKSDSCRNSSVKTSTRFGFCRRTLAEKGFYLWPRGRSQRGILAGGHNTRLGQWQPFFSALASTRGKNATAAGEPSVKG